MKKYVKPEITVKEYRVSEDIAATLKEYYYQTTENGDTKINVSLFLNSGPIAEA